MALRATGALTLLVPYLNANSGILEAQSLLDRLVRYVNALGLDKSETSCLYEEHDKVDRLLFNCFYLDA